MHPELRFILKIIGTILVTLGFVAAAYQLWRTVKIQKTLSTKETQKIEVDIEEYRNLLRNTIILCMMLLILALDYLADKWNF
jgi:uncharacterized membrane protein YidH (DUF202 family)